MVVSLESASRRPFGWILGYGTSLLGDQIYLVALTWAAASMAGPAKAGLVLAAAAIPRALLMLAGGVVVDRFGARSVMLASDLLRAMVMVGAAAVLAIVDNAGVPILIAVAFIFGTVDSVFYPASGALPARLFPGDRLTRAQGMLSLARHGSVVIGGPLGGFLVAAAGIAAAFLINALTFVVSFACLAAVRVRPAPPAPRGKPAFWASLREGLAHVASDALLRRLMLAVMVMEFGFVGPFVVGVPLAAQQRGWGPLGIGIITASFGAGAALSAVALTAARRVPRAGLVAMTLAMLDGVFIAVVGLSENLIAAAAATVCIGLCAGMAGGLVVVLIQANAAPDQLGRVMSLASLMSFGLAPLSMPLTGLGVAYVGLVFPFAVGGALHVVAALVALAGPTVRNAETPRASSEAHPATEPDGGDVPTSGRSGTR